MNGILNLLKPPGMTSSDAVLLVRRMLPKGTKTGHGGTLDPDAAGVLPILVGRATRLFDYLIDKEKTYVGELCFGAATDTQDATGAVLETDDARPDASAIRAMLPTFTGPILQCPPAYSALKRDGVKLCDLARRGVLTQTEPRLVVVKAFEYCQTLDEDRHLLSVRCEKGVYIRTLFHDLARSLGAVGHMAFLLRTQAGVFGIEQAVTVEELMAAKNVECLLSPMDKPLCAFPALCLPECCERAVRNGNAVPAPDYAPGTRLRVYLESQFAGLGEVDESGLLRFCAMLL